MKGNHQEYPIALVIGAGPAGLFTAQELVEQGAQVMILNRDIKPGGLAEYGIYHDKHRIKSALRQQFRKILADEAVSYYGNVAVGEEKDLSLDELRSMGFDVIVVAVGAQGTKWLGIEGESLDGVYHAKDLIYHYNDLPPYSERSYPIGDRVALIGVGNVMADLAHWLVRDLKVDEVIGVARRGPAEVKFTPHELGYSAANLDVDALDAEIERVRDRMEAVGQDPDEAKAFILSAREHAPEPNSDTRLRFRFLSAMGRILDDGEGHVDGLEVENTRLVRDEEGKTHPKRLDTTHTLDIDTVIFCIGDRVSEDLGLPVDQFAYAKHPSPEHPVEGVCYEAYDPEAQKGLEGVFLVGWARKASKGQVGLARKDAKNCVKSVISYLENAHPDAADRPAYGTLKERLEGLDHPVITKADWHRLEEAETQEAERRGVEHFRYETNAEMLEAIGKR